MEPLNFWANGLRKYSGSRTSGRNESSNWRTKRSDSIKRSIRRMPDRTELLELRRSVGYGQELVLRLQTMQSLYIVSRLRRVNVQLVRQKSRIYGGDVPGRCLAMLCARIAGELGEIQYKDSSLGRIIENMGSSPLSRQRTARNWQRRKTD